MNEDYQRAVLRAVSVSTSRGKRPARAVVLNAAAAALNVSDRPGLMDALFQLIDSGLVADRRGRLLITESGKQADQPLEASADKRLADHLSVTFKEHTRTIGRDDRETLFLIAVAEHHQRRVGVHTIADVLHESLAITQAHLDELVDGGYLTADQVATGVTVYALDRAGRFELRRGELRQDSIRYPQAQSFRARELVQMMSEVLDDE